MLGRATCSSLTWRFGSIHYPFFKRADTSQYSFSETAKANSSWSFHSTFITKMSHVRIRQTESHQRYGSSWILWNQISTLYLPGQRPLWGTEEKSKGDPGYGCAEASAKARDSFLQIASVASCFLASFKNPWKLAMEILCDQRFIQTERGPEIKAGKCFWSNPFLGSEKETGDVSDFARQSAIRGHGMSNFFVRILTVIPILNSPVEIREKPIQFSMEREFFELSPELEDSFVIFEHIRGFNVTILTSAKTKGEILVPWSGFFTKRFGGNSRCRRSEI